MARAFEDVFGIGDAFGGIAMPGRTDAWILSGAASAHGISAAPSLLAQFRDTYLVHLARALHEPAPGKRKGVMPGVRALLDRLSTQEDTYLALLTGNYEEGARLKLEYFDLWRYFRCGAYGDEALDRNALLPMALARIESGGGPAVPSSQVVIVGDTPFDIGVAIAGGAHSIAVATGSHSVEELRAAGADLVFETLADTDGVIDAILRLTAA
jgi:phosphoglycolate phosphatase-like HAD superfamily hydrolase